MKKAFGLVVIGLLMTGCATKEYVKSQVDPLADRLAQVEAKINSLDDKMKALSKAQGGELSQADKAALQEARETAKKAADEASKALADAQQASGDARKAEAAAKAAEDAAKEAEKAAKKSEKMFRLEQKK